MTPKKLHRFFIDSLPEGTPAVISDVSLVHQIVSVLKFSVGESFIIFTNGGPDITVTISAKDKKSITIEKITTTPIAPLLRSIIACISITKSTSFELAVQKLTEVGVSVIVPIISERTIKQSLRIDRLERISIEALEQSGGNTKVTIHEPMTLSESFKAFPFFTVLCDAYDDTTTIVLPDTVVMYVGPEGGWSDNDRAVFDTKEIHQLKLGDKILRTETAAIIGAHTLL
ncbi:RsmE family RNA methyltransferase, partial [Patescibacteria group bacterium]|nr:RsmE family RNA methyltransferase [Patescibacteria group bacterium]